MPSAHSQYFYRCYSATSAGELRCGLCQACPDDHTHPPLSIKNLLFEFDHHRDIVNRKPTALVSVTDRPLEALNRALSKHYEFGEDADTIFIITIRVLGEGENQGGTRPISAKDLAKRKSRHEDFHVFKHEYLFQWEIPENYVLDCVSLKTLLGRDIEQLLWRDFECFSSFNGMQKTMVDKVIRPFDPYGTGRWIGTLALALYAEECTHELAFQVMLDCFGRRKIDEDGQYVYLYGSNGKGYLDFSDICVIEGGIRDALDSYFDI